MYCEKCGYDDCRCDQSNEDGYVCDVCGYVPTTRELQRGWCPLCSERKQTPKIAEVGAITVIKTAN